MKTPIHKHLNLKDQNMKTKINYKHCLLVMFLIMNMITLQSIAQTPLFSQNFNSSSSLATYINNSSPTNGQFNAISVSTGTTATITSNALQFVRSNNGTGSFARTTNLSPVPSGIIFKFDLTVANSTSSSSVARWQVGDGFSTSNSTQSSNDCYAQFAIDFRGSNNYRVNDITNGDTYANISGTLKTVTWVLNRSGNTLSYNAPDGTVKTVSNDRTDVWVGTTRYISGQDVEDNANIEDIKFVFSGSSGTITMDNMTITQYIPIVTTQPATSPTACVGSSVSFTVAASGLPTPTVKWQKNISSVWTDISGATSTTYTISSPVVGDAGQFRALFTNSEGSTNSNTSTLTVNPSPNGGSVSAGSTGCSGSTSGTLNLSGHSGTVQKWQSSTNGGSNWNDISNTTTTLNYTNLTTTTMYRAVVINLGCTANSTSSTVTVNPNPTLYTVNGGGSYCVGGNGVGVGLSDTQSGVDYQLKVGGVNTGSPVAGTGNSISFGNQTAVDNYTVVATNATTGCTATMTGSVNVSTTSLPSVSLAITGSPSCYESQLTATNSGGTLGPISASNNSSVNISSSGTPTVTRTITMPAGVITAASNITLTMNIDHSRAGNLVATLISPSCGQTVIFNRPGGNSNQDNLIEDNNYIFTSTSGNTFPGSSGGDVPNGTYFASFSGLTLPCNATAGVWTLQIEDKENNGGGNLNSWSLSVSNAAGYTTVFNGPASVGTVSYPSLTTATVLVTPPNGANNYSAVTTDYAGCVSSASNTVVVNINPTVTITSQPTAHAVCLNQTTTMNVAASGTGLTYQWRKGTTPITNGGRFSGADTDELTITSAQASDAASDYNVLISDGTCSATSANAALQVTPLPLAPSVTPNSAVIMLGGLQNLVVQPSSGTGTLGTGTSTNNSTSYPATLGTYYGGARHQILVLASELTTMGIQAGEELKNLTFSVSNTNNAHAMINYTISIGNTALTSLNSTFVNGLTQVYYSPSYAALNGINNFVFSTPYTWNGTSNIIIETVFNNNYLGTATNPNCSIHYTTTGFTSVNYSREDNAGAGNAPILALTSDGTSTRRPNMTFGHAFAATYEWTPTAGLFTDNGMTNPYLGGNANDVYASPSGTTTYSISAVGTTGCFSATAATSTVTVVTTPPDCVTPVVNGSACITGTSMTWSAATNYPQGYYVYVAKDNPMTDFIVYQQDVGSNLIFNFPTLEPNTTYYYYVAPYNSNGENINCPIASFVSGVSQAVTPTQLANSYTLTSEGVSVPTLPCGILTEDYDGLGTSSWYTSTTAPYNGVNHMRIDKNSDGVTGLDDWFFSPPINVVNGKVYRITWFDRIASGSTAEHYKVYIAPSADASTMTGSNLVYTGNTNSTSYAPCSSMDYLATSTGQVYFGFRAMSPAGAAQSSLYLDDIQVKEIPVSAINPAYCTTIPSMYQQIYVQPVAGATNYRYKIVGSGGQAGYDFQHYRNNGNIDYRLKWAPGVIYGYTYNISVSFYKNGIWSPYGAACPVSLGAFPAVKLRDNPAPVAGPCDFMITDLNQQVFSDSLSGANDYMYKIVENDPNNSYDYDFTWQRNSGNLDYRLVWAYQAAPLIERVRYGYSYDVQVRALVGKTGSNFGNRPGEWGPYGVPCKLDLTSVSPTTSLVTCGVSLNSLNDQIFTQPISGATNYQYEISGPNGYLNTAYRNNGNNDFRLSWIPNSPAPGGVSYATTYSIRVRANLGGAWLDYGPACTVTTPAAPITSVPALCGVTLAPGQFSSAFAATAVPGATQYAFRITNVDGVTYNKIVYNYNANNTISLSRTLVCCGYQNMLPNTTYTIEVAYFAGTWSAYGPPCTFTTGATVPRYSPFESGEESNISGDLSLNVYPNPAIENQNYSIELVGIAGANEKVELRIFNLLGESVYNTMLRTKEENTLVFKPEVQLPAGVYVVEAILNETSSKTKFVIK